MNLRIASTLTAFALLSGLATGCTSPVVSTPAPSPSVCAEDDPCFDPAQCYDMGNFICPAELPDEKQQGWDVWDEENGGRYLKVDPSRAYRVEYDGTALRSPLTGEGQVAVPGKDGKWHVFTAIYTP